MTEVAQNPDELFDVVDYAGRPTGVRKRRADIHRDGDWHRAIHLWFVCNSDGIDWIVLQRRSFAKDTLGGKLDATVGGHLGAGETLEDALREAEEEIGVTVAPEMVVPAGRRIAILESPAGPIDRELQYVFFVRDDRQLASYTPNPVELDSLIKVPIEDLLELLAGHEPVIVALGISANDKIQREITISKDDFEDLFDRYYYRVAIAARQFLIGVRHFSV